MTRPPFRCMSQDYWEDLYQKGDTGWDKGEPSPGLVDYLRNSPPPIGSVLVPGCGTGHDVREWARHGFHVTGMDIAPSAIQRATEITAKANLKADFRLGNLLADTPDRQFDYVFEHTLFCAIQPTERDTYVQALRRWLKPDGKYVAVFFLIPNTEGPPFGSTPEEIKRRFEPFFVLEKDWVPRSWPNRKDQEWMTVWKQRRQG